MDKHDVVFSGFNINEDDAPWDASHGWQTGQFWASGSQNIAIENSCFKGSRTSARDGDNYAMMRIMSVDGLTVRNVECSDVGQTDENSACLLWYFTKNVLVEHNLFRDSANGVYMKGNNTSSPTTGAYTFRFNKFINTMRGIRVMLGAVSTATAPNLIAQNAFVNNQFPLEFVSLGRGADPRQAKFLNNVLYNQQGGEETCFRFLGGVGGQAGVEVRNNICAIAEWAANGVGGSNTSDLVSSELLFATNVYTGIARVHALFGGTNLSFATWQSTHGQDLGSLRADPQFVNAALGDFRLAASSPARTVGRARFGIGGPDGRVIPAGPYITGDEVLGPSVGRIPPP